MWWACRSRGCEGDAGIADYRRAPTGRSGRSAASIEPGHAQSWVDSAGGHRTTRDASMCERRRSDKAGTLARPPRVRFQLIGAQFGGNLLPLHCPRAAVARTGHTALVGYPSGQRGRAVNHRLAKTGFKPPATVSDVRTE